MLCFVTKYYSSHYLIIYLSQLIIIQVTTQPTENIIAHLPICAVCIKHTPHLCLPFCMAHTPALYYVINKCALSYHEDVLCLSISWSQFHFVAEFIQLNGVTAIFIKIVHQEVNLPLVHHNLELVHQSIYKYITCDCSPVYAFLFHSDLIFYRYHPLIN